MANVPSKEARLSSQSLRPNYTGNSIYQKARQKEKDDLVKIIVSADILSQNDAEILVAGIPNSKLVWANVVIKRIVNGTNVSPCDVSLLEAMWMPDTSKDMLKKLTAKAKKDVSADITPRYPTRGKIVPSCDAGVVKFNIKNPGVYNMYTGQWENYPDRQSMYNEIREYNKYGNNVDYTTGLVKDSCGCEDDVIVDRISQTANDITKLQNELVAKLQLKEDTSILDTLNIDPKYKKLIDYVRNNLYDSHIDLNTLKKISDAFSEITDLQKSKYFLSVLDPFKHRGTKIPTEIPVPTANFSIRSNLNLTTNALGNCAFFLNPFYLTTDSMTMMAVNNDSSLTGASFSDSFLGIDIGQSMPAPFYTKYRLVSAGLRLTFTSSQLQSTGFATVGVDFSNQIPNFVGNNVGNGTYAYFNNIENSYFKETKATRNGESLQVNYIPLDSSFTDFTDVGVSKGGFNICGYISGAQASTTIARVDIVLNYEATVAVNYTDYLPCQVFTGNIDELKHVNRVAISLQQENKSLSPESLKEVVQEVLPQTDFGNKVYVGLPKPILDMSYKTIDDLDKLKKKFIEKQTENIPVSKKNSILGSIMSFMNPIASGVLQAGAKNLFPSAFGMLSAFK